MCSFLFTNKTIDNIDEVNRFMKLRGPDGTNVIKINGHTFIHNILSITGDYAQQPFVDGNIVCVYNGQIYNYDEFGNYKSDGECLIPLYKKYGKDFILKLDGEFAIVLVDYNINQLIISTDVFATKPLWFYVGDDVSVASYQSAIGEDAIKLEANTTQVYDLSTKQLLNQNIVYEFNLTQYKTTFDDWIIAFEKSIHKRTKNLREDVFIGLSSGYDSGAISCELNRQNVPYKAYCIVATEDHQTLNQRFNLFNSNTTGKYLRDAGKKYLDYINQNVEEFKYRIYSSSSDYNEFDKRLHDDRGSGGLSMIFHFAKKEGKKINLSGSGADEIFSDYGFGGVKKFAHSNFGGLYPENLSSIFPWASFYGSSMVSYLAKEEYIAGAYGIETRYPYLDKDVVQEFLWLHHTLKNSNYKSVLHEYFTKYNYPVKLDTKNGFGYIAPK